MTANSTVFFLAAFGVFIFFLSYYITSYIRNYSLRNNVIDIPNERSSHVIPTPTGGGLAISLSIFLAVLLYGSANGLSALATGLGAGILLIGIVGWMDIHREVAVLSRAVLYLLASVWAVFQLGGLPTISFGTANIELGMWGSIFAILSISWLVNLYNFMDGTDGLAAVQAVSVAVFSGALFYLSGQYTAMLVCMAIIFSSLAFLIWNWAPAKIFMGDVGSCSIGFAFGVLAIYGEITATIPVSIWLILLSVFIADASFTLCKRVIKGEKWYRAHNTHAYQRLVQMGLGHDRLALYVLLFNIFICGPLACISWKMPGYALPVLLSLYSLLGVLWLCVHNLYSRRVR